MLAYPRRKPLQPRVRRGAGVAGRMDPQAAKYAIAQLSPEESHVSETRSCHGPDPGRGLAPRGPRGPRPVRLTNKPIKLIVGFAPGGSTDIVARIVARRLGERLGQTVVVENRAGAGGTIGADLAAKSAPDGYTLTLGTTSTHAIAAGAYSKLAYNPVNDFTPISLVAITPYLLVVNPSEPRAAR